MKKKLKERRIKQIDVEENSDSEGFESSSVPNQDCDDNGYAQSFGIKVNNVKIKQPRTHVSINGQRCKLLVDTGSSINVLSETLFSKMKMKPKLSKPDTHAYAYGQKQKLPIKGKFTGTVETPKKIATATFYVIEGKNDSLLSYETSVDLGIVPEIKSVTSNNEQCSTRVENLVKEYSGLFEGIGKLKDKEIKLHIDEAVPPVAQPHRRIPFHLREKV